MKTINSVFVLSILTLFIPACCVKHGDGNPVEEKFCSNEISLFSVKDSIKTISIDYGQTPREIINCIEKELGPVLSGDTVCFGLELPHNKPIRVYLLKEYYRVKPSLFNRFPEAKLLLNHSGQVMFDFENTSIDSLKFYIDNYISKKEGIYGISMKWTMKTPNDSIEKTFKSIIDGYLMNYEELSRKLFSKSICELSSIEIDSLKKVIPFEVRLDIGRKIVPPEQLIMHIK